MVVHHVCKLMNQMLPAPDSEQKVSSLLGVSFLHGSMDNTAINIRAFFDELGLVGRSDAIHCDRM